jgi:uncharacterized membrane protein
MNNKLKMGTPGMGILCGCLLMLAGALIMWIGFWRTLVLIVLFGIGYFLGAVSNKGEVIRDTADRIVPKKDTKPIDFVSEVRKDQEISASGAAQDFAAEQPDEAPENETEE